MTACNLEIIQITSRMKFMANQTEFKLNFFLYKMEIKLQLKSI